MHIPKRNLNKVYLFIYNNSARCQAKPNSADNAPKLKGSLKKSKKEHQTKTKTQPKIAKKDRKD